MAQDNPALFAPVAAGERSYQFQWFGNNRNYGLRAGSVWANEICYAPNRAILIEDANAADTDSSTDSFIQFGIGGPGLLFPPPATPAPNAWLIRFGPRLLSLGAADWANERHLEQDDSQAAIRCLLLDGERILEAARHWHARPGGRDFIAEIRHCSLSLLGRDPCPAVPRRPEICVGWRTLYRRSMDTTASAEERIYWNARWEAWVEEHRPGYLERLRNQSPLWWRLHIGLHGDPCTPGSLPL